jgi:uncharacterized protein YdeI (YjbR/CyaY-like superfamily)
LKVARPIKAVHLTTREAWRKWLARHHASETEIWLIFFKQHTGKRALTYNEAVEEALCYGWIDSIVRRRDDETYLRKFTPRRTGSKWSAMNVKRVRKLVRAGMMTDAGLAVVGDALQHHERIEPKKAAGAPTVPADVKQAMAAEQKVTADFKKLPPGYVRMCLKWIDAAKKPETRARRIAEFVAVTAQGKRIGLK